MKKTILTCVLLLSLFLNSSFGVEGMWIPTMLKKYNIEEMQKLGFKLSAEDIYDVNNASMKDAVVLFGSGCTGELISNDGLLITNHHCGFGQIQAHSSLEHDYLSNGFWAKSRSEELINKGLTVSFLVKMEDVTSEVNAGIKEGMEEEARKKVIVSNIESIRKQYIGKNEYTADVKPLFYGNQYFVYVYEVFKDVRLVGAPPVSIGKFGGDTDNWMWPRHTGDFSLFRIYASKDNKPASYSPDNVPYHPKKFFKINLKGIKEGDFTMVFGYPGTTQEYLPSQAVELLITKSNPNKVDIRTAKLSILEKQMAQNAKVRIQYASKYAGVSNSWKKWQGETKGLLRLGAVDKKREEEQKFKDWVKQNPIREKKYGNILADFAKSYAVFSEYQVANDIYTESIQRGSDFYNLMARFNTLAQNSNDSAKFRIQQQALIQYLPAYFKDYDKETDQKVFSCLLRMYLSKMDPKFFPEKLNSYRQIISSESYIQNLYSKSIFSDSSKIKSFVSGFNRRTIKQLHKDKLFEIYSILTNHFTQNIEPEYQRLSRTILAIQKQYMAAILEMRQNERIMADANLTLRVTYGKVEGYEPLDGVHYKYESTLKGVMEKSDPDIADYAVDSKLRNLYNQKNYGIYTNAAGEVPVTFSASNHTTGGNSGSPVVNSQGELIGVNFDRCWEGTMSDILFDPDRCRNIALDVRYALFIIDKFANSGYLLNEMMLIK